METLAHYHFQTVHFPIALTLTSGVLFLIGRLRKSENLAMAGRFLLYLATLGTLAAVSTGLMAEKYLPHSHEGKIHEVMEWHETLGLVIAGGLLLTSILSLIAQRKNAGSLRTLVLLLLVLLAGAVGYTGYLGGRLGHEFGIGVNTKPAPTPVEDHPHDHPHAH